MADRLREIKDALVDLRPRVPAGDQTGECLKEFIDLVIGLVEELSVAGGLDG
jgi:hypothetical protein